MTFDKGGMALKIGTCIHFIAPDTIENQLSVLVESGFDNCQLVCWDMSLFTPDNAVLLSRLSSEYSVKYTALWCGWEGPRVWNFYDGPLTLGLVPAEFRSMRIGNLKSGSDFAAKLGIGDLVTHMGFIPENPSDSLFYGFCDSVSDVAGYCRKNSQHLLFETGQETPVTMLRCFETADADNLGVNLDTANLIMYGKADPAAALLVLGKYVRGVHAKDGLYPANGRDLGMETPIGDGAVDFCAVINGLADCGYDGYITIEREIGDGSQRADIKRAAEYLSGIISDISCRTDK